MLDIFNCSPTNPPDGHQYLEVVFVRCGTGMQVCAVCRSDWAIVLCGGWWIVIGSRIKCHIHELAAYRVVCVAVRYCVG